MTEPSELVLSSSSMNAYLACEYRYYLDAVVRRRGIQTIEKAIGQGIHAGIEAETKPSPLRPDAALERAFEAELEMVPLDRLGEIVNSRVVALKALDVWRQKVRPTLGVIRLVEAAFVIRVMGILVSGRIDYADEDVHDAKSTETPSKLRPGDHVLQMTTYRYGYRALTGDWPRRLLLDVIGRNGRFKQVEVEPDEALLVNTVGVVSSGIMEGRFEPTGAATGICKHCPFVVTCRHAVVD